MPNIHLLIRDEALLDAVTEQLTLAKLGTLQEALPEIPPAVLTAVIIDEALVDDAKIDKLRVLKNNQLILFHLGALLPDMDGQLFTESFPKPLRLGYLITRLRFMTEIAPQLRSRPIAIGSFTFEAQQRNLLRDGDTIRLTEKESALLEFLSQSPAPVGREELLASVWGYDARIDTHTLETHIYQLRRKIGSELIVNENGLYRLGS